MFDTWNILHHLSQFAELCVNVAHAIRSFLRRAYHVIADFFSTLFREPYDHFHTTETDQTLNELITKNSAGWLRYKVKSKQHLNHEVQARAHQLPAFDLHKAQSNPLYYNSTIKFLKKKERGPSLIF